MCARNRAEWLAKINEAGVRRRAEFYYQQFNALAACVRKPAENYSTKAEKQFAVPLLRQIPSIGPIRAALLVALIQGPSLSHQTPVLVLHQAGAEDLHEW